MNEKYVKLSDVIEAMTCRYNDGDCLGTACDRCENMAIDILDIQDIQTAEIPHWHNLTKNPDDLPEDTFDCLVKVALTNGIEIPAIGLYDEGWIVCMPDSNAWKVVKWCKIPKDDD